MAWADVKIARLSYQTKSTEDARFRQIQINKIKHTSATFASKDHHGSSQIITTNKLNVPLKQDKNKLNVPYTS